MNREEFKTICNMLSVAYSKYNCWKGKRIFEMYPIFENEDYDKCVQAANWYIKNSGEAPSVAEILHFKPKMEEKEEQVKEIERDKYGCPYVFHTNNEKLDVAIVEFIHFWMNVKHLRENDEYSEKGISEMLEYIGEIIKDSYCLDSLADSIIEAVSNKSLKVDYKHYEKVERKFNTPVIE